jgi:hypothetical protein
MTRPSPEYRQLFANVIGTLEEVGATGLAQVGTDAEQLEALFRTELIPLQTAMSQTLQDILTERQTAQTKLETLIGAGNTIQQFLADRAVDQLEPTTTDQLRDALETIVATPALQEPAIAALTAAGLPVPTLDQVQDFVTGQLILPQATVNQFAGKLTSAEAAALRA